MKIINKMEEFAVHMQNLLNFANKGHLVDILIDSEVYMHPKH